MTRENRDNRPQKLWELKRLQAIARQPWCTTCPATAKNAVLTVHHRSYGPWENDGPHNLVVLCLKCHRGVEAAKDNEIIALLHASLDLKHAIKRASGRTLDQAWVQRMRVRAAWLEMTVEEMIAIDERTVILH